VHFHTAKPKENTHMRKLRRLPWRLPKPQDMAPAHSPPVERADRTERRIPDREPPELQQPVAYAGGRYVYGHAGHDEHHVDTRRARPRHRTIVDR
jgi:hypothetical protein